MLRRKDFVHLGTCTCRKYYSGSTASSKFWKWTTKARPDWKSSYGEAALAFAVFGITGSSSLFFIRPVINQLGIEGNLKEGPNTYRIFYAASILISSPVYATLLLFFGTISGRHIFFAKMSTKILSRFLPSPFMHRILCQPARCK